MFLVDSSAKGARLQRKLVDVAERARGLARRFGLQAHMGVSHPNDDLSLPESATKQPWKLQKRR